MGDGGSFLHAQLTLESLQNRVVSCARVENAQAVASDVCVSVSLLGRRFVSRARALDLPVIIDESFSIERRFCAVSRPRDLWSFLDAEVAFVELLAGGCLLATFESSALQLLLPSERQLLADSCSSSAAVELLLEPTDICPEQLAPALLLSVDVFVHGAWRRGDRRPSVSSHKTRALQCRPPFAWRHADSSLLARTPGVSSGTVSLSKCPSVARALLPSGDDRCASRGRTCHCAPCVDRRRRRPDQVSPMSRSRSLSRCSGARRSAKSRCVSSCTCSVHRAAAARRMLADHCEHHCVICAAYQRRFARPYQPHFPSHLPTCHAPRGACPDCAAGLCC